MTVTICDVAPRDGLQNQPVTLTPAERTELVNLIASAGVRRIEAVSFVSPKAVPQMAGAEEVVTAIERRPGVVYAGLALNEPGFERLLEERPRRGAFCFRGDRGVQPAQLSCIRPGRSRNAERIVERAKMAGIRSTVTIAVAFGCPFEGPVDPGRVAELAARVAHAGADETPSRTRSASACPARSATSSAASPGSGPRSAHLHNTRNTGFANAYAALEAGATVFDASAGGIGGCPFAPRATGNIATEDLVYLFHGEGVETGIDLDRLITVAEWLEARLGRELEGQVYRAGTFAPVAG